MKRHLRTRGGVLVCGCWVLWVQTARGYRALAQHGSIVLPPCMPTFEPAPGDCWCCGREAQAVTTMPPEPLWHCSARRSQPLP